MNEMSSALRPTIVMTLGLFALTGLAYPAAVTGIAQAIMPEAANGSLITRDGTVVGSALIGQAFTSPSYLHPRPSAAGKGYDPLASGGSNYGPTAKALVDRIAADQKANPGAPADLLTASASGLDPHVSPQAALYQAPRIAAARHMPVSAVRRLIADHTEMPVASFLGQPRVNVLEVNLALDSMGRTGAQAAR